MMAWLPDRLRSSLSWWMERHLQCVQCREETSKTLFQNSIPARDTRPRTAGVSAARLAKCNPRCFSVSTIAGWFAFTIAVPCWYQVMTHAEVTEAEIDNEQIRRVKMPRCDEFHHEISWNIWNKHGLWLWWLWWNKMKHHAMTPIRSTNSLVIQFEHDLSIVEPPPTWQESKSQACILNVKALVSNKNAEGRSCHKL